jgi:hypothetical protein
VDTGTVRATDFTLDRDTQDLLFRKGREAALNFLDGAPGQPAWDWETYKRTYRNASRRHQRYHTTKQQDQADPGARDSGWQTTVVPPGRRVLRLPTVNPRWEEK